MVSTTLVFSIAYDSASDPAFALCQFLYPLCGLTIVQFATTGSSPSTLKT